MFFSSSNLLVNIDEKVMHPEHELFMFGALTGWSEMTKMFCTEGRVIFRIIIKKIKILDFI